MNYYKESFIIRVNWNRSIEWVLYICFLVTEIISYSIFNLFLILGNHFSINFYKS